MRRRMLLAAALILAVTGTTACSKKTTPSRTEEQAYQAARTAYSEAETPEDRAAVAEDYLAEFPGGEHAPAFAWVVVEYRGKKLGEPERAFDTVMAAIEATGDPGRRLDMLLTLYPLSVELGRPLDLEKAVASAEQERPLGFARNRSVMEVAAEYGLWDLLLARSEAALAQATPEAVRAEHPGREVEEEKVLARAEERTSEATAYRAWALFNTGAAEEAMKLFAAAEAKVRRNYVGLPDSPVARFWGEACLERGEWDRAMELLAPEAVMGGDSEAMAGLERAWREKNGSGEGLEEFLRATRRKLARNVDDFTLPDYEGRDHTLSRELGQVTLLAFWFPT